MSTHEDPDILNQMERLNLKTDSNTTAITQLAEIVRYQVIQAERDRQTLLDTVNSLSSRVDQITTNAERDRQHFQNSINDINQRQQAQLEAITIGFREISQRVEESRLQTERDREAATADRQQSAIDRQAWQSEIRRIWEYLYLLQGRNGSTPS